MDNAISLPFTSYFEAQKPEKKDRSELPQAVMVTPSVPVSGNAGVMAGLGGYQNKPVISGDCICVRDRVEWLEGQPAPVLGGVTPQLRSGVDMRTF